MHTDIQKTTPDMWVHKEPNRKWNTPALPHKTELKWTSSEYDHELSPLENWTTCTQRVDGSTDAQGLFKAPEPPSSQNPFSAALISFWRTLQHTPNTIHLPAPDITVYSVPENTCTLPWTVPCHVKPMSELTTSNWPTPPPYIICFLPLCITVHEQTFMSQVWWGIIHFQMHGPIIDQESVTMCVFVRATVSFTIRVKHSGDKPNCRRLVWVLLWKLYQKLKCSCKDRKTADGWDSTYVGI